MNETTRVTKEELINFIDIGSNKTNFLILKIFLEQEEVSIKVAQYFVSSYNNRVHHLSMPSTTLTVKRDRKILDNFSTTTFITDIGYVFTRTFSWDTIGFSDKIFLPFSFYLYFFLFLIGCTIVFPRFY